MITAARVAPVSVMLGVSAIAVAWIALVLIPMRHEPVAFTAMWLAMSVAMMVPTVLRPLRRIAGNSLERGIAFLAGYILVWLVIAVPAFALMQVSWSVPLLGVMWVIVGLNQAMPWTHRALRACQRLSAHHSPWRSGLHQGVACVIACAPLMAVAMVTLMSMTSLHVVALIVMAALTLFMVWEKQPQSPLAAIHASALVFVGVGVVLWLTSGSAVTHIHI
jgi:predicted metal-binding membrane protein